MHQSIRAGWVIACVLASLGTVRGAADALISPAPLPPRMLNVVPWGDGEARTVSATTPYLSDGWTPERLRERLSPHGIDTLRVMWQSPMLDNGAASRWFDDIDALSRAGFKLIISCHTHLPDSGGRFSHYNSKEEGDLPVEQRTAEAAPTWHRFVNDWKLVAWHFKSDPNVLGYEVFNEYAPSGKTTPPGRLFMRDLGAWLDELAPLTTEIGKGVWVEGPWATTTFSVLAGQVDDRGRSLADLFDAHEGRIFPAIHVYNWYGKGWNRPETIAEVRAHLADPKLPKELKPPLEAIAAEPDPHRARLMLHQFNFDRRFGSTKRLIDDARRVCGVGPETQVWLSESGTAVGAWTGDGMPDSTAATQFRAIVRAANAGNVSIAFWVDRGKTDGWGFFSRYPDDPRDPRREEYHEAFFDRAADRIVFDDTAQLSTRQ